MDAPATGVGTSIGTAFREWVTAYNQQWNFNIQRELNPTTLVEVAYVGSRGQRIWINRSRTAVSTDFLSLGPALGERVPNPYFGKITTGALSVAQVRRSQLLQPFNHYTGVSRFRDPIGDSVYHSFTARLVTNGFWMSQIARNISDSVEGLLIGKRYLIHDRDPLFTAEFLGMLADSGVKSVKLPPRSLNLNAYAERFVRTIKESCLNRMILFGEDSLRRSVQEFTAHYHLERNHQGLSNRLIIPPPAEPAMTGAIQQRQRLGGMLNYYYRDAA